MQCDRSQKRPSRRGAAVVEFAIVAPVFLTLMVGTLEVSRALVVQQLLTNASREGARVGSYDTTTSTSTISSAVNTYLSNEGISGATTTVSPSPPSSAADGQSISVTVSIAFNTVSWIPPFYLSGKTLSATSVMCRVPAP